MPAADHRPWDRGAAARGLAVASLSVIGLAGWQGVSGSVSEWVGHSLGAGLAWMLAAVSWRVMAPWSRRGAFFLAVLLATAAAPMGHAWMMTQSITPWVDVLRYTLWILAWLGVWALWESWRHQRLLPSLAQARLQALHARMQPHFLFNSLNSVLALVRRDPARAESVLIDLADLYRALLAEPGQRVALSEELALARAYLAVEQVRLGARLSVIWRVDTAPANAWVPMLLVQPLVENAVRHGVEPSEQGASVTVEVFADDRSLVVFVRNPIPRTQLSARHRGHGLALANLRERLALHYGSSARLKTYVSEGEFVAQVSLPIESAPCANGEPPR
jgi:two-component system sensor histidine kinase AlgZ